MSLSKSKKKKKIRTIGDKNHWKTPMPINTEKELTYVMIKPGFACYQNIVWDITSMIKQKGLKIEFQSTEFLKRDVVALHYIHLKEKSFYQELIDYMSSDFVVKLVVSGKNAVKVMRDLCGPTNPANAPGGTIRKKYGMDIQRNVIHASESKEEGRREIRLHCIPETVDLFRRKGFEL